MASAFSGHLGELADSVEKELFSATEKENLTGVPGRLGESMRYALTNGGKRVRPVLVLAACEAIGGRADSAMPAALAIEALHTYTLVHDDMPCMDDDTLRRGQPTVHVKFGYAEAVLAGDALQAFAFDLLSRLNVPAERKLKVFQELSAAAGPAGVIGGQWEDVTSLPPHSAEQIEYIHNHKTADLIRCSVRMGAHIAGADSMRLDALTSYAVHLGIAFQIIDDLLDGADAGGDGAPDLSCLEIWDADTARAKAKEHTDAAMAALSPLGDSAADLLGLAGHLLIRKY